MVECLLACCGKSASYQTQGVSESVALGHRLTNHLLNTKQQFVCVFQGCMSLRDPPYDPPSVSELQEFLLTDRKPTGHVNQVWPNLYIGNE